MEFAPLVVDEVNFKHKKVLGFYNWGKQVKSRS